MDARLGRGGQALQDAEGVVLRRADEDEMRLAPARPEALQRLEGIKGPLVAAGGAEA